MKKEQLFEAINNSDDKYVLEVLEDEPQQAKSFRLVHERPGPWKIAAAAVCAAVICGGLAAGGKFAFGTPSPNVAEIISSGGVSQDDPQGNSALNSSATEDAQHSEPSVASGKSDSSPENIANEPEWLSAEEWGGRPHVLPIAGAPEDFDFLNPGAESPYPVARNTNSVHLSTEAGVEVYAVDKGEVMYAEFGFNMGYDNAVVIKHAEDVYCIYGHLSEISVQEGDFVKAGQPIGLTGISGLTDYPCFVYARYDHMPNIENSKADEPEWLSAEEWGGRPHVLPTANTPEDFDFLDPMPFERSCYAEPYSAHIYTEYDSEVYTVDDGEVMYVDCGYNGGYGFTIIIKHAENVYCSYAHLSYDHLDEVSVQEGDFVQAGQLIGFVGTSGRVSDPVLSYVRYEAMPEWAHHRETQEGGAGVVYQSKTTAEYDYVVYLDGAFLYGKGEVPDYYKDYRYQYLNHDN